MKLHDVGETLNAKRIDPLRVLLQNTLYSPDQVGGAEKSVQLLAQGLKDCGLAVAVCAVGSNVQSVVKQDIDGVLVYRVPNTMPYWQFEKQALPRSKRSRAWWHVNNIYNLRSKSFVADVLSDFVPDVINTNNMANFTSAAWVGAHERGIPIVHTLRDYSLACVRASLFNSNGECNTRCISCVALTGASLVNSKLVKGVIGISHYILKRHRDLGYFSNAERAKVIRNIAPMHASKTGRVSTPSSDRVSDGKVTFSYLGRLHAEKGVEVLLSAVSELPENGWRLVLAGTGEEGYVNYLKRKFNSPNIDWLGFSNADDVYSSSDCVIIPSVWPEPLSRVMIESLVRGIPVIAARVGGLAEIATPERQAITYNAVDHRELARALLAKIVEGSGEGGASRKPVDSSIIEEFTVATVTSGYVSMYEQVTGRKM